MNIILKMIREELQRVIDNIDAGNSNATEEEMLQSLEAIKRLTDKEVPMTKYQACKYLLISRATFDNLVKGGKLPKGEKLYAGDSNIFWLKKDLDKYKYRKKKSS